MTLTQQNRQRLAGYLTDIRTDWHLAGTSDAISKLSLQHPTDDLLVAAKAIAAARDPHARGPAAMLGVDLDKPAVTQRPTPSRSDPECPEHGGTIRDDQGRYTCCRDTQRTPVVGPLNVNTSRGPTDEARAIVAAALDPCRPRIENQETGR